MTPILLFAVLLTIAMLLVMYFDFTRYTIPNWLNGLILLLFPIAVLVVGPDSLDWLGGIYALGAVFAVGFLIFAFGVMGGGDIKLLCVCALWCGWGTGLLAFLTYTALLGGALSLLIMPLRLLAPWLVVKLQGNRETPPDIPKVLTYNEPIPYGLAIAPAFLIALWSEKLFEIAW